MDTKDAGPGSGFRAAWLHRYEQGGTLTAARPNAGAYPEPTGPPAPTAWTVRFPRGGVFPRRRRPTAPHSPCRHLTPSSPAISTTTAATIHVLPILLCSHSLSLRPRTPAATATTRRHNKSSAHPTADDRRARRRRTGRRAGPGRAGQSDGPAGAAGNARDSRLARHPWQPWRTGDRGPPPNPRARSCFILLRPIHLFTSLDTNRPTSAPPRAVVPPPGPWSPIPACTPNRRQARWLCWRLHTTHTHQRHPRL